LAHGPALAHKVLGVLPDLAWSLFAQCGPGGVAAAVGLAFAVVRGRARGPALVTLGLGAVMVLLVALTVPSRRYLLPLLPLLGVAGALAIDRLARAVRLPAFAGPALAALIAAFPMGYNLARDWRWAVRQPFRDRGTFTESEWQAAGDRLAAVLPPGTLITC